MSNVIEDGKPLPHFTPYPSPASVGVDVFSQDLRNCDGLETNVYCFPPFTFIKALLSVTPNALIQMTSVSSFVSAVDTKELLQNNNVNDTLPEGAY